ncbi:MAG: hypothetical protein K2L18_09910 [Acetatifactor sp.]|nr:hypothetical protein [Acetatifactor sp.]
MTDMKAVYYVATALVGAVMFWAGLAVRPLIDSPGQQETVMQMEEASAPGDAMNIQQAELSAEELAARGYLSAEALDVRIDDGEVQWFDGVIWHGVASVEEMAKEDKFYVAQEIFREFEEQLKQREADSTAEGSDSSQGETLSIVQREEPKPTAKPQSTKPTVTEPVTVPTVIPVLEPQPTPASESNGGGGGGSQPSAPAPDSGNSGSGGGNSGGGDGGSSGSGGGDGGSSGSGGGDGGSSDPGSGDSGSSGGGDTGSGDAGGSDSGSSDTGDGENMEWSDDYL